MQAVQAHLGSSLLSAFSQELRGLSSNNKLLMQLFRGSYSEGFWRESVELLASHSLGLDLGCAPLLLCPVGHSPQSAQIPGEGTCLRSKGWGSRSLPAEEVTSSTQKGLEEVPKWPLDRHD